jgi:hypothetical protein
MAALIALKILMAIAAASSSVKPHEVAEIEILAAAQRDAAESCSKHKEGCEYTIRRADQGWSVHVAPITRSVSGERVYVPGAFDDYIYSAEGKLVRVMPGL